jgi:PAS domain S-box-containing protein
MILMIETLSNFIAPAGFEPLGHCFLWNRALLWLYVSSDSVVALSYFMIPIALFIFVRKRRDLAFNWIFLMFGAFILACGTTHLVGIWTLWKPVYWLDGSIKALTATVSFTTAVMLWPLIPKALALPSLRQLEETNRELQGQIAERGTAVEKLQQSEERFRLLVEGVQDCAIYMLNVEGVVNSWNSGAQRLKGYQAEEIIGKHFSCFFRPEDIQAGKPNQALEAAAAKGQYEEENFRVRKDGSVFWANVLITALYDSIGQLYGFAKLVRDITERKETEQRLRDSERLATLGTTAAVFAHEIANPLNGLSTSLQIVGELIRESGQGPLVEETLEIAHEELKRLTALLNDYRSFARPQRVKIQPTNLRQIFEEVLAPATKHYKECGITLELEFDDNLPLVPVDRQKIKQVILNLCKNAVEAMPEGGTLKCKAYQTAGRVILEVADTGTGIPEGLDVFQLFKTTKHYGTGLGLPIVGQIISEHRGTVNYVTKLGKGTAFIVSLPLSATG